MSYARMSGEFSDLYLISTYRNMDDDDAYCWQCISCKIEHQRQSETMILRFIPDYYMFNLKGVYRHLRHHIMYGHKVPIEAIQRVVAEYYDIHVSRLQELWPHESWQFDLCDYCGGIKDGFLTPYCDGECGLF